MGEGEAVCEIAGVFLGSYFDPAVRVKVGGSDG
jgi:hypothetical protein